MARIGFDFDRTLAVFPRGSTPDYDDVDWCLANSAALPVAIRWLRLLLNLGHEVIRDCWFREACNPMNKRSPGSR